MQHPQFEYRHSTHLSTKSSLPTSSVTNKVNGLLHLHRLSQASANIPSLTANHRSNQSHFLTYCNSELRLSEKIKYISIIIILTITFAILLTVMIELATTQAKYKRESKSKSLSSINNISNSTNTNDETILDYDVNMTIHSYFIYIWLFHVIFFFICLIIHVFLYQHYAKRGRAKAAFLR